MPNRASMLDALIETRGVVGAYEVDTDGFLLGSIDIGATDKEAVAAISAVTMISSERLGEILLLGELTWVLLEFDGGKVVMARRGNKLWVIVAENHVLLGDVVMKIRDTKKSP